MNWACRCCPRLTRRGYKTGVHFPQPPQSRPTHQELAERYHAEAHEHADECRQIEDTPGQATSHAKALAACHAGRALAWRDQALAAATAELVERAAGARRGSGKSKLSRRAPVTESVTGADKELAR